MYLAPILSIILIRLLRKSLQEGEILPKWNRLLAAAMYASIAIIIIQAIRPATQPVALWIAYAILLWICSLPFLQSTFRPAKQVIYAAAPLIAIELISDLIELIDPVFLKKWDNYFETAGFFAIIWMIAMLIINGRQRKALQKERLRAQEIEKENKITESLKAALEIQVAERTAALTTQKEALQNTLNELTATQAQLIQSEKMASLGELTAGIAHEIQNPLNFVNNFSEVNKELIEEMKIEIEKGNLEEVRSIAKDIADNEDKINHHGKRADAIVKGMLQHSRSSNGQKEPTDINALADEYFRLAYHGLRAKDKSFNATLKTDYDNSIDKINIIPQDMGRVILNLITNAFYTVTEKKKGFLSSNTNEAETYDPTVTVSTRKKNGSIEISVKDNGNGIPKKSLEKIFQPFFTTKPTGQGTGLGLSLSYDIVTKGHAGEIKVETKEGEGTEFIINLNI